MNKPMNLIWEKSNNQYVQTVILIVIQFLSILGLVSLISGAGFTSEVQEYRNVVLLFAFLLAVMIALIRLFTRRMRWSTYYSAVLKLKDMILDKSELGGIRPHIVIGVNEGGAILGALLYYLCNRTFHFVTVWSRNDLKIYTRKAQKEELIRKLNILATIITGQPRILLVDDSFKTGTAMEQARSMIKEALADSKMKNCNPMLKTAVIVFRPDYRDEKNGPPPDYHIKEKYTHFPYAKV